jgi:hypothetical protein
VTSGIATAYIPVRFQVPPEIVVLTLTPGRRPQAAWAAGNEGFAMARVTT